MRAQKSFISLGLLIALAFPTILFSSRETGQILDGKIRQGLSKTMDLRFQDALAAFEAIESEHPDHPAGPFFGAYVYWWMMFEQEQVEPFLEPFYEKAGRAVDLAREGIRKDKKNGEMHFYLGNTYALRAKVKAFQKKNLAAARDAKRAKNTLQRCLKYSPSNTDACLQIGIYNYVVGSLPGTLQFLRTLLLLPGGDKKKGLAQVEEVAEKGHFFKHEARMVLAAFYLDQEYRTRTAQGLRYARRLQKDFPRNLYFPAWEGQYYSENGLQPDRALGIMSEVVERMKKGNGNFTPALKRRVYYLHARILLRKHRIREALEVLTSMDEEVEGPPPWLPPHWWVLLGEVYDFLGEKDKAVSAYRRVLSLDKQKFRIPESLEKHVHNKIRQPANPEEARFQIGILKGKQLVSDGLYADAVRFFTAKRKGYPKNPEVEYWLALSHFLGGNIEEAEALFTSLTKDERTMNPEYKAGAWLRLGQIRDLRGERKEAVALYRKAKTLPGKTRDLDILAEKYLGRPCLAREPYPTGDFW